MGFEQLGNYEDKTSEITDTGHETEEDAFVNKINEILKPFNNNLDTLASDALESLSPKNLADFLSKNYFSGESVKSYSDIKKGGDLHFLDLSMKAALKFLLDANQNRYNKETGAVDNTNGVSAEEVLKDRGGIDMDGENQFDNVIVKIVQDKVRAKPDGLPGPQTIAMVISKLGGDISQYYQKVNNLYPNDEKLRISIINNCKLNGTDYNYDSALITISKENGTDKITYSGKTYTIKYDEGTKQPYAVELKGDEETKVELFTFDNGWIKIKAPISAPISDPVSAPVEAATKQNESEETEIRNLLDKMPYKSHFRFALKDNTGKFSYYSINPDGLYQYQYNEDTDNFKSAFEYNDYNKSDYFKALTNEHLKGVDSGAYEIRNATYNDVTNAINGIDIEHPEKLSDDQLALIGEKIPRPGRWAYSSRVKLGRWCVISSNGTGGKDFITRCEKMGPTKGGLPEEQLTVKNWWIFEGYLKKKMNTVDKIYYA